jgi:hypothetical protein
VLLVVHHTRPRGLLQLQVRRETEARHACVCGGACACAVVRVCACVEQTIFLIHPCTNELTNDDVGGRTAGRNAGALVDRAAPLVLLTEL